MFADYQHSVLDELKKRDSMQQKGATKRSPLSKNVGCRLVLDHTQCLDGVGDLQLQEINTAIKAGQIHTLDDGAR